MSILYAFLEAAFLACLLYILYLGYRIYRATQISARMPSTTPYEQRPIDGTMRILVAGDSTGLGRGARTPKESVAGRVGAFFPKAELVNISENGLRLAGLQEKLGTQERPRVDLAVIHIGANDVTHFTSLGTVRQKIAATLDLLEVLAGHSIVLTSGDIGQAPVFWWPVSALVSQRTCLVRKIFIEEIQERSSVSYVDLFREKGEEILNSDIPRYYAPDGFHPSGDGYGVWFERLLPTLSRLPPAQSEAEPDTEGRAERGENNR